MYSETQIATAKGRIAQIKQLSRETGVPESVVADVLGEISRRESFEFVEGLAPVVSMLLNSMLNFENGTELEQTEEPQPATPVNVDLSGGKSAKKTRGKRG